MNFNYLIQALTLEEKCAMLVGLDSWHTYPVNRLSIPSITMADGPHGLRKQYVSTNSISADESIPSVCFPPAVTVASSFDPRLTFEMGEAIASECLSQDVQVLLGPGINIKRNPLCGRNFEYYSEDPYLTSEMAKGFIKGVQSKNVSACVKHYALNSQESYRMVSSSVADERTIFEIYLKAFQDVLEVSPDLVMCSYNKIDGVYASENTLFLDTILRKKFGFKNVIVSDWTAVSNRTNALKATLDLEMPGYIYSVHQLVNDYKKGKISMQEIDASVERILRLIETKKKNVILEVSLEASHQKARKIARESMVLLKNTDELLPLSKKDSIALIGRLAKDVRYQGGGSSHINPYKVESLVEVIPNEIDFGYCSGYTLEGDGYDTSLIEEAIKLASSKNKVVLVVGLTDVYESEGYDRKHLSLPKGHLELINALAEVNQNIIVVLQIGSPIEMPWISKVKTVLNAYLGGEACALAISDLLFGKENPSGRLAETFPLSLKDVPSMAHFAKGNHQVFYKEGIYVGYRFYQSIHKDVLFPFGYGLSYSKFEYFNLVVSSKNITLPKKLKVSVTIKNTGKYSGKEVIQLYIENPQTGIFRPRRELRQFKKIELDVSQEKTVEFVLTENDFNYYDVNSSTFVVSSGEYKVQIRKNARDELLEESVEVKSNSLILPITSFEETKSYYINNGLTLEDSDFEKLLGRKMEQETLIHKRPFCLDNNLEDISSTLLGKLLKKIIVKASRKEVDSKPQEYQQMVDKSVTETPLRSIVVFSGGLVKMHTMQGFIDLCNLRFFKAFKSFVKRD